MGRNKAGKGETGWGDPSRGGISSSKAQKIDLG